MSELRIVKGNDFTTLYKITATYADGTEVEDFDLRSCTDVQVLAHKKTGTGYASIKKDISSFGSYTLEEDNILRIAWDGLLMKNGTYTVDFIAKFRGADIRSYSIRDLVFDIVETNEEANIPAGAFVDNGTYRFSGEFVLMFESQLQADWEQTDDTKPDYIKNKPTIPQSLSELSDDSEHRTVTDSEKSEWNNKGTYSKPQDGIPATDLTASVQASLNKANTALQSESDPTVPSWAKASTKPSYTASEVGALPASTHIPTTLAELTSDSTHRLVTDTEKATWNGKQDAINDLETIRNGASLGATAYQKPSTGIPASDIASGVIPDVSNFITRNVDDLVNYYLKSETYTKTEVQGLIAAINQFHYEIYPSTSAVTNPQGNVLYLIGPTGTGADKYEEYVYANNTWVKIGDTSIDLSGYVTTQALNAALANYTTTANLNTLLAGKQDVLTFDSVPTQNSNNPVKSGGVYDVINSLKSAGYVFAGVATTSTSPGTPTEKVFYIGGAGTYANFGTSVTVPVGSIGVFKYNGSWAKEMVSDGLYNDFGIKIGILNLVNLLDTGVILEQGGIETTGGDSSTHNAIRTSVPVNTGAGFIVAVPNGYNITRVLYYSSYTDNDNFTLGEYVAAGTQLYEVKTTYPLVRFMFGAGGAKFTPATFLQNLFLTTPKIEELKNSVFGNLAFSNNGYINASTGAFVSTISWRTTDFIPVNPSDTFTIYSVATGSVNAAFYDENKAFKSSIAGTDGTKTITAPSAARYMRCSSLFGMTRPNPSITPNVIVYERVVQALNKKIEFVDNEIKANNIDSFYPVPASTATITTALTNSFYSQLGTTITTTAYQGLGSMVVENIEVGKKYFLKIGQEIPISSYNNYFIFAKSTTEAVIGTTEIKNYVELYDNAEHIYVITIPPQCTRVYTAGYVNTFSTFYVKDFGTKPLKWLALTSDNVTDDLLNEIKASQIMLFDSIKKPFDFSNKKFVAFGDSITQGVCSPNLQPAGDNKYISLFCSHVGANLYNYAISGSCIADDANEVESIHTTITSYTGTADIIFVAGGINDWQTEVPFGEYNDTDTSTFYGALNSICSYLKTNYASAEVIFVTPIPTTSLTVFGSTHRDNPDLYRKAIQEKAAANGFSVVNGAGLGLPNTMSDFGNIMFAPTDRLHPTLAGHAMYFRSLCGKLL